VLSVRNGQATTFEVGRVKDFRVAELDGAAGSEVLFTNMQSIAGVPQRARAAMLVYRRQQVDNYDIGQPNSLTLEELDGTAASEVVLTNLRTVGGVPQPAQVSILTGRTRTIDTFELGQPNAFQFAELDGAAGNEILFTNLNVSGGVGQPAKATLVNARLRQSRTFDVGTPNAVQLVDLDGIAGQEIVFSNISVVAGVGQPALVTVVSARSQLTFTYNVGSPTSLVIAELDGADGNELAFVGSNQVVVVTQRSRERTTYDVGSVQTISTIQFDGSTGLELFVTRLDGSHSILNHRTRRVSVV